MDEIVRHNSEDETEVDAQCCGKEIRLFDKLTLYNFSRPWTFVIPLDGKIHEFVSPVIRTRREGDFDFAWRLSYRKARRGDDDNNKLIISWRRRDKRSPHFDLNVNVSCYMAHVPGFYPGKLITELERDYDLSQEAPMENSNEFSLWDHDHQCLYHERLLNLLENKQNHLNKLDSLLLELRVEFEFLKMDNYVCTSLELAEDLATLKHNDELTDVTFQIGGKELKAHKCILAARSPVFAKMFEAQETQDNKYSIDDIEADVFEHLLTFVYCGKSDDARNANKMTELRLAAEKFGLTV